MATKERSIGNRGPGSRPVLYTPGPWIVEGTAVGQPAGAYGLNLVATIYEAVANDAGNKANARLIAAAPEFADQSETIHMEINGLHATMRATCSEYRTSELCRRMDALIRDNSTLRAKALGTD